MSARFATTVAVGDPASLAGRCIAGMPVTDGATLGILYTTEPAAAVLPEIARALAEHTGIRSWVGGVGLGSDQCGCEERRQQRDRGARRSGHRSDPDC